MRALDRVINKEKQQVGQLAFARVVQCDCVTIYRRICCGLTPRTTRTCWVLSRCVPVFCNRFSLLFLMVFQHMNNRLLRMLKRKLIKGQQQEARYV